MKIGVIGAGTMGQGIAKAFAQVEGNTVALCDTPAPPPLFDNNTVFSEFANWKR